VVILDTGILGEPKGITPDIPASETARATGASILATGCPRCNSTLTREMNSEDQDQLAIMNLVRLVAVAAGLAE